VKDDYPEKAASVVVKPRQNDGVSDNADRQAKQ
jgi:hypothetical protein